jgi:hypothetical protein
VEWRRGRADDSLMTFSREVAVALELAETTVPYARSREGEAERWLRVLRRLERTGEALASLGVPDGPLESPAEARLAPDASDDAGAVEEVAERATMYARARGGEVVGTIDLLFGVLGTYGKDFSKALYRSGVPRDLLLDHLTMQVEEHPSGYLP